MPGLPGFAAFASFRASHGTGAIMAKADKPKDAAALLKRIADALERFAPKPPPGAGIADADAFVWHAESGRLEPVRAINRVAVELLKGIERQRDTLIDNTRRFAKGLPAKIGRAHV